MLTYLVKLISQKLYISFDVLVLFTTVICSYLICLIYAIYFKSKSGQIKSIYFLTTSLLLNIWAYGFNAIHSLINCCFCYLTLKCFPKRIALTINMIFTMTYLLYGYYLTQINWNYTLTWTMPQCLLTLRLIAFSFDVLDGHRKKIKNNEKEQISSSSRHINTFIINFPHFLNYLSYCYFPASFFVGPLITYVSYEKLLKLKNYDVKQKIQTSIIRLIGSILITIIYVIGSKYWSVEYLLSEQYYNLNFFWKWTSIAIVAKIYMYKYILCWLISESSCLCTGITQDETGNNYCNVNYFAFETATSFTSIIKCYNITTNTFAFKYIYRRLKFLGNIYLSQIITLSFLSIWHGFESGYHMSFFVEFLLVFFEKNCFPYLDKYRQRYSFYGLNIIIWIIGRLYTFYFLGYGFLPFIFLYQKLWWPILSSIYFICHLLLLSYFIITLTYKYLM